MRLKIDKMYRKEVNTVNGPSTKLDVYSGGKRYSAWHGEWNQGWRQGDEVEADVVQNGQYLNLKQPKAQTAGAAQPGARVPDELMPILLDIKKRLLTIEGLVRQGVTQAIDPVEPIAGLPPNVAEDLPPHTDDDQLPF